VEFRALLRAKGWRSDVLVEMLKQESKVHPAQARAGFEVHDKKDPTSVTG
jgi:hypothetical protein